MRRFLLFFICLIGVTTAFGQFTSRGGRFKVDQVKGCAPFTITITDTNVVTTNECTAGKPCLMDFEGKGTTSTNSFNFTYTTPGTYKLSVLYQSIGADDITVTVTDNTVPTFEVFSCTNNKVTVKVTDKSYDSYLIDFNTDGAIDATVASSNNATAQFNYGAPGNYNITVRGKNVNAANNCQQLSEQYQTITTLPTPTMNAMTAIAPDTLKLDMGVAAHIEYKLDIAVNNATTFQSLQELYEQKTVKVPNLLIDQSYYCFRLDAFDPCANTNTFSGIMCSQDFDVDFTNGANKLTWKTATTGINSVTIKRNNALYTTIPGAPLNYNDTDYTCGDTYQYQVITNYGGGHTSTSLVKGGTGIFTTTYPPIDNINSSVVDGAVLDYKIYDPTIKPQFFNILKSINGSSLSQYSTTKAYRYIDSNYDNNGKQCYQVNYQDQCKNQSSPGIVACPISLQGSLNDGNNVISLNWNAYKGYRKGVATYVVHKYTQQQGEIGAPGFSTTDTTFVDNDPTDVTQIVVYRVVAIGVETDTLKSYSNTITFKKPVKLILPTAFTPNGDALNGKFTVVGKFVQKMTMQIFDRWGVLVYYSNNNNEAWDGTKDGKPMPESAYVWKAEVTDDTGAITTQQGTVLLLRPPH